MLTIPEPRGALSATVITMLAGGRCPSVADVERLVDAGGDPLSDGDFQLALACCYELHYRGLTGVDDSWEWDPRALAVRAVLETAFEHSLHRTVDEPPTHAGPIWGALRSLVDGDDGPALSVYLAKKATLEEFREFLVQRSVYHLREADSHTWGIPRLSGPAKAALVEIQADEYGCGAYARMHSTLFAQTLRALKLDDSYGSYWDVATAETLAGVNAISMFGLHRRLRGCLVGHLAALEMTSTEPNRNYGNGLRRLGHSTEATAFFDEHVEADAAHEQIAAVDLCGSLVETEPELRSQILWGAAVCLRLDAAAGRELLGRWNRPALTVGD